jgi:hypothetical protein
VEEDAILLNEINLYIVCIPGLVDRAICSGDHPSDGFKPSAIDHVRKPLVLSFDHGRIEVWKFRIGMSAIAHSRVGMPDLTG